MDNHYPAPGAEEQRATEGTPKAIGASTRLLQPQPHRKPGPQALIHSVKRTHKPKMYIPSTQGSPLARETIAVARHCPLGEYKYPIESNPARPKMQHASRAMGGVVGVESKFLHTHNYTHIRNTLTHMLARDTQIYTQRED